MADEKLTCGAIFPDASLELLACGTERGALSLWFRSGDEDGDMGRTCGFVPHSDEVTAIEFSKADRAKVGAGRNKNSVFTNLFM